MNHQKQIQELVGTNTLPVLKVMEDRKYHCAQDIEKRLKIDASKIRATLYHLQQFNFLENKRVKDEIRKYYVTYWKLKNKNIKDYFQNHKKEAKHIIREFYCEKCRLGFNSDDALECHYNCYECGGVLCQKTI